MWWQRENSWNLSCKLQLLSFIWSTDGWSMVCAKDLLLDNTNWSIYKEELSAIAYLNLQMKSSTCTTIWTWWWVSLLRLLYDKVNDNHGYCMEAGQTKLTRYMDVFSSSFWSSPASNIMQMCNMYTFRLSKGGLWKEMHQQDDGVVWSLPWHGQI
jgi:hypothetical protein